MRTFLWTAILMTSGFTAIHASPQGGNVVQQLQATYIPNAMDAIGNRVLQPGSILVVQVDGMLANKRGGLSRPFANSFENGQIRERSIIGLGHYGSINPPRPLAAGEKVYLLKTDVKDKEIVFLVQSCGTCNQKIVDPSHQPYRAEVSFKFVKGALASTDFKSIQSVIEQVFKFPGADSAPSTAPAPTSEMPAATPPSQPKPDAHAFDDPPPPPPPPVAKKLSLGQTMEEVKAMFGEPESASEFGDKTFYKYKDVKVTFVKGKVTDVE